MILITFNRILIRQYQERERLSKLIQAYREINDYLYILKKLGSII